MTSILNVTSQAHMAAQMEQALKEATHEAGSELKMTEPDDVDYWDVVRNYDEENPPNGEVVGTDVFFNADEPNIDVVERIKRLAYPGNTNYIAKIDINSRNMKNVKRWAKNKLETSEFTKTWAPCHHFWQKRHEILVEKKLIGDLKAVYTNMDNTARNIYDSLYGHQKTNFVVQLIAERLFQNIEEDKLLAKNKFLQSRMRYNQTAREYIDYLEAQRFQLRQIGEHITDVEFRSVLMSTLNESYRLAVELYDYTRENLEEVKARLLRFNPRDLSRRFHTNNFHPTRPIASSNNLWIHRNQTHCKANYARNGFGSNVDKLKHGKENHKRKFHNEQ